MHAGKLRHRVMIQEPVEAQGADGGITTTWDDVQEVWASIAPATMREQEHAAQLDARITHTITMRGRPLPPTYRLLWGTRVLAPTSVLNEHERGILLTIMATEAVPGRPA